MATRSALSGWMRAACALGCLASACRDAPRPSPARAANAASARAPASPAAPAPAAAPTAAATAPAADGVIAGPMVPLVCPTLAACTDAQGVAYTCEISPLRTGRSTGMGRRCRPSHCEAGAPCVARPLLSGEVATDADSGRRMLAGVVVSARPVAGGAAVEQRSDARGLYHLLVSTGQTLFVGAHGGADLTRDLHAVTMPATGFHLSLELWPPAALAERLGSANHIDPARGIIAVQFAGLNDLVGVGAASTPPAPVALTLDAANAPVAGNRLRVPSCQTVALYGVAGPVTVTPLDSATAHCALQAGGAIRWPVEPNLFTQVDVECVPVVAGAARN